MTKPMKWPPKDYMIILSLVNLFLTEKKLTLHLIMTRFGLSKSTANRYLKILREVFGMRIYFVRNKSGHGGVYIAEGYGCFKTEWFGYPEASESSEEDIPEKKTTPLWLDNLVKFAEKRETKANKTKK